MGRTWILTKQAERIAELDAENKRLRELIDKGTRLTRHREQMDVRGGAHYPYRIKILLTYEEYQEWEQALKESEWWT